MRVIRSGYVMSAMQMLSLILFKTFQSLVVFVNLSVTDLLVIGLFFCFRMYSMIQNLKQS